MTRKNLPERLSICLVAEKFPIIGRTITQGFIWPIAKGLAKAGHNVTVLSWQNPMGEPELEQEGVHVYFLGGQNSRRISQFPFKVQKKFAQLHGEKKFHLVHSLSPGAFFLGKDKKKLGIAVAYDVQATKMASLFSLIGMSEDSVVSRIRTGFRVAYRFLKSFYSKDRHILHDADGVFVNSPEQQLALERYYLYPEKKTYKVPYGIEIGDLSPRQGSDELRKKLNIPKSAKIAVTVTDMVEKQDVINILRAFQSVVIKKPSSYLIIVGDGPLYKEIEFEMLNLALGSHVVLTGAVPAYETPDYVDLANVFVNIGGRTSGYEPSLLEAMIQEKVIIGSEVSPISTIVEDGVDGFLIRPADVATLSQLLLGLFQGNIPAEQVGKNARSKVLGIFDTQKMVQETVTAYEDILQRSKWVTF